MRICAFLVTMIVLLTAACSFSPHRRAHTDVPNSSSDFVDLAPGELIVVVPLLESGGYILPSLQVHGSGNQRTAEAGRGLIGYQTDTYKIKRKAEGIQVQFEKGVVWLNGRTYAAHSPRLTLFGKSTRRYIRLIFLTRVSDVDHDMAVVSADDYQSLGLATAAVLGHATCYNSGGARCAWIPNGVGVRPNVK